MNECIVCGAGVQLEAASQRTFIDPIKIEQGVLSKDCIVVCERKRCLRLVMEVMDSEGRREVKQG